MTTSYLSPDVLTNALLAGVQSFEAPVYEPLFSDSRELAITNMAVGALLADLQTGGVTNSRRDILYSLREEAGTLAKLVGGESFVPGLTRQEQLREHLGAIARGLGAVPQVRLQTAVERVKGFMRSDPLGAVLEIGREIGERNKMSIRVGEEIVNSNVQTPEEVVGVLMQDSRTEAVLAALQPGSGELGNKSVLFELGNGVTIEIKAKATHDTGRISTPPERLDVSIRLTERVRQDQAIGEKAMQRFWDLRMGILFELQDSEVLQALARLAGWEMDEPKRSLYQIVLQANDHPDRLKIDGWKDQSSLSVALPAGRENYVTWLSWFLKVHLLQGVFEFRPDLPSSGHRFGMGDY